MQKFRPQYRRLLFIDRKIREKTYPNCSSLAAEWEVSEKTIQRDIDYLRDELNAPVVYDQLKYGFYYKEANFSLPAISISESDLFSVCVAQTVLDQFRNTPIFGKLSSVFRKIRDSLPDKNAIDPAWMNERILVFPEPATNVNPDIWDTLAKALRDNRRLAIHHRSPLPEPGISDERVVDPWFLVSYRGEWYLSAFCHRRKSIRTFAVSRIAAARILENTFRMPSGMNKKKMFGDQFGIVWKSKSFKVRIRFSPDVAPYIRERKWHPAQKIRDLRDGGLVIEFVTNHLNEVSDWVLSWGAGATVLAPDVLLNKVRSSLKDAIDKYP